MISLGRKETCDAHGMFFEHALVLKDGVPVLLPASSFVASKINISYRGDPPPNADTECAKLVVHDLRVLSVLQEVDKTMRIRFKDAPAYRQLLVRDNCIITRKEHALLAQNERLFVEFFSTNATCKPRLRMLDIDPYVKKITLTRELNLLPELNNEIAHLLLQLFWI